MKRIATVCSEVLPFTVPLAVWVVLFFVFQEGKSLSNLAVEPMLVLGVIVAGYALRVYGLRQRYSLTRALVLGLSLCVLAVAIWRFVPSMPE